MPIIAFVGSIVENEMRGPTLFPDILDLTAGFIQKITSTYGLNGLFWENIIRQTVYILVLVLIIPMYTILSCLLFSNMQEIKTAKTLQEELESFGKRDRFKESEVED